MKTATTLRPGFLVSLKTALIGNVGYDKEVIQPEYQTPEGQQKAKWSTERTIVDPAEHEAAVKVRSKAAGMVRGVCARSAFGLLCPLDKVAELEQAIVAARAEVDKFNLGSKLSRIYLYTITGRIEPNDGEAIRAINSEVRDLLSDMEAGVKQFDVDAIREAATKAKNIGSMLSPDAQARIQIAIDTVRSTARKIVSAGEAAAMEIDKGALQRIGEARSAFLDLDDAADIAIPEAEARAVDFEPEPELAAAE